MDLSRRDCAREAQGCEAVARHELPWVNVAMVFNTNGVAARTVEVCCRHEGRRSATTPLVLESLPIFTQGSSCLATASQPLASHSQSLRDRSAKGQCRK